MSDHVNTSKPKLGEQIDALAKEWGEGFEEDVAQPLAEAIKASRENGVIKKILSAYEQCVRLEAEVEEQEETLDNRTCELEIARKAEGREERRLLELEDVARGVLTIDEMLRTWRRD